MRLLKTSRDITIGIVGGRVVVASERREQRLYIGLRQALILLHCHVKIVGWDLDFRLPRDVVKADRAMRKARPGSIVRPPVAHIRAVATGDLKMIAPRAFQHQEARAAFGRQRLGRSVYLLLRRPFQLRHAFA